MDIYITTTDVHSDGDYRLLIADADCKLKVYKGTSLAQEINLLDVPCAMAVFYSQASAKAIATPLVAVASGSYVYIYKKLRPHYKFQLPKRDVTPTEKELWDKIKVLPTVEAKHCAELCNQLTAAQSRKVALSPRSTGFALLIRAFFFVTL